MPQAITAFLVSLGVSAVTAAAISTAIITTAVSIGISFVSRLLFGGGGVKSETSERAIKTPTPPRVYVYGVRRMFGASMFFDTASDGTTVDVWAFADHRCNAVLDVYLNDEKVSAPGGIVTQGVDGRYRDNSVTLGYRLGLAVETAFAPVVAKLPGIWTNAHRGDGITSGYLMKKAVKSKHFLEAYPQGDNVSMSLVLEGQLCFDPRSGTKVYTTNAALHLLDYFIERRKYDYAAKILPVISYWIAAANDCDAAMPLKDGGTEPRYRGCVTYDASKIPGDVISELLACFDGWTAQDENGCHIVYSGRLYEPTVSIGPEHIVSYTHQSFVEEEDTVNELVVQYVSSLHDYNTVECQAWRDEDDISFQGRINSDGFSPQVPSHSQARRLAKRSVALRNAPDRGTVTTNIAGRAILGQRYINLHIEEAGAVFFSGRAQILGAERDYDTGGVSFDWVAVSSNIDAWNPATEEGDPAPVGNRVAQQPIATPTIASATPSLAADGSSAQVAVTVNAPDRADLTWFGRWKVSTDSVWNESTYSDIDGSLSVVLQIGVVPANASIDVSVAYQIGDGRTSDWSATSTVSTSTAGLAPSPTTNVSATGGAGQITVNWRNPGSTNYSYTRNFYGTTNVFGSATALTPDDAAGALAVRAATYSGLAPGSYYVWSRAYSASGVGATPTLAGLVVVT